jgi:3-oxoacyl-[acyl-carrier-protein] synthase II
MDERVVISGLGAVTPLGADVAETWAALLRGRPEAFRPIRRFETRDMTFTTGGEISMFTPHPEDVAVVGAEDRATLLMMTATREAMVQARWIRREGTSSRLGVVLSTNFGSVEMAEAWLGGEPSPGRPDSRFEGLAFQRAADHVAHLWGAEGPVMNLSLSCASGTAAIGIAVAWIRAGLADAVLAGGYDALSRFAWLGLSALRTMSRTAVRPFDRRRDGTIFSEGSGALVVERETTARQRGAPLLAVVAGYGLNNNAFHMTAPAREGAGTAAVMRQALADAGLPPEAVDHINAHGTGTPPNDVTETQAIKAVFGAHAARIPITSIKGTVGHLMGAAGSVEAIASILTLREGMIPPVANLEEPDPECDLDYVRGEPRRGAFRTVLSNSAGIGGCNAAVIVRQP